MKSLKPLILIMCATVLCLLYVHQQVELVKLSYSIERNERKLKDMLDHNQHLSYNINNLQSPSRLEHVLMAKKINLAFPKKSEVVGITGSGARERMEERVRKGSLEKFENILKIIDIFSPGGEVQAVED